MDIRNHATAQQLWCELMQAAEKYMEFYRNNGYVVDLTIKEQEPIKIKKAA